MVLLPLVRQIRRHHDPFVASSLDGKNVSVGIEPCNATGIRPRGIGNKVADHDLSVRLHNQGLRGVMEPAEPEGRGTEAGTEHPGFAEKLYFRLSAAAVRALFTMKRRDKIIAVRLENGREGF